VHTDVTPPLIVGGLVFFSSLISLNSGLINQSQYSVLIGVVIASAVIPKFIAQKWFYPVHSEDIIENGEAESAAGPVR
jgi:hypothetical protein